MMTADRKIEIEYQANAKDYRRILLWYQWKKLVLSNVVIILVAVAFLYFANFDDGLISIALFLLFLPIIVIGIAYWSIWRQAGKIEKVFEPAKVVFSEEGMQSTGESASASMKWDKFHKVQETSEDFIFFPQHNIFYTVPKRFFHSQNEISEFRELLGEKLADRATLQN